MKKTYVILPLVFLLLCGCGKISIQSQNETAAEVGGSAASATGTADAAAPATQASSRATPQQGKNGASTTAASASDGAGQTAVSDAAKAGTVTISKKEIEDMIVSANSFTLGWLHIGFEAKKYMDAGDTIQVQMDEYSIPYTCVSGAPYRSVDELKAAVQQFYAAEACEIFDGFIQSMYLMKDGKLYVQSTIGQSGGSGFAHGTVRLLSQTENECRLQLDETNDPSADGQSSASNSRTVTLINENGLWRFTAPVTLLGLYNGSYQLAWAE